MGSIINALVLPQVDLPPRQRMEVHEWTPT